LLITGGFAACVNLFGRPVMHFLYAGKFDDVAPLLGMLALLPVVMTIGNTMNDTLKALEKPKLVFYAYVCSGSITLFLGAPLVTRFGLRGVVYGMLLSATAYTVALAVALLSSVYRKEIGTRYVSSPY
jgi:O-antigen/teichoic acid export membrane protein